MFKNLEEKVMYYRGLTDYRLMPKTPIILFLDGRGFSMFTNKFKKPYDSNFINMMNETAKFLCENIDGCKIGYTQSDEISLYITNADSIEQSAWFSYRLSKLCSIAASLATSKFNQLNLLYEIEKNKGSDLVDVIKNIKLAQFDCKAWNVPSLNDLFCWFLYRQNDCIKNSKQMACQTMIPHKKLVGKHTDEQIAMLLDEYNIDWFDYKDGEKYGRFITKELKIFTNSNGEEFTRNKWVVKDGILLNIEENKNNFLKKCE